MKHKHPKWLRRLYITVFACAIGIACALFVVNFYTTRKAIPFAEAYAKRQGIDLKINKIKGWFPIQAEIAHIGYVHPGLGRISINNVSVELYKIPLLRRRLRINRLIAATANLKLAANLTKSSPSKIDWPNPFFGVEISKLVITATRLTGTTLKEPIEFSIDAKGVLDSGASHADLEAQIGQTHPFEEVITARLKANKRTRFIETRIGLSEEARGWAHFFLSPYLAVEKANLQIDISGHISSWLSWLRGNISDVSQLLPRLKGDIQGSMHIDPSQTSEPWARALIGSALNLKANFFLSSQQMLRFENISLKSEAAEVKGEAKVNFHEKRVRGADLDVKILKIPAFAAGYGLQLPGPFTCKLKLGGAFDSLEFDLSCYKQRLCYIGLNFENISGNFDLMLQKGAIAAKTHFFCYLQNRRFDLKGSADSSDGDLIHFNEAKLTSSSDNFSVSGIYSLQKSEWTKGHIELDANRFSFFNELTHIFPSELVVGRVRASGDVEGNRFKYNGRISQLELGDFYVRTVDFSGEADRLFNNPKGTIKADFAGAAAGRLQLPFFTCMSHFGNRENSLQVFADNIDSDTRFIYSGHWIQKGPLTIVSADKFEGRADNATFSLEKGGRLVVGADHISLSETLIKTGGGFISVSSGDKKHPGWQFKFQEVPAGLLHLFSTDLSAKGNLSGEIILQSTLPKPSAHADIEMQNLSLSYEQWPIIDQRSGSLQVALNQAGLDCTVSLRDTVRETLFFSTHVPARVTFDPFSFKLEASAPFNAELRAHESASNFLQYLNSLGHALGGHLVGEIMAKGSLERPTWSGALALTQGRYENYQTGMILTDVNIDLIGLGANLDLKSFKAKDPTGGHLTAYGTVNASPIERFPFELSALFENSRVITLDDVKVNASGLAKIKGNLDKAKIEAKMKITHANIAIPDTIRTSPPSLGVEFIHQRKKRYDETFDFAFAKKIQLEVTLDTESTVEVGGRGLQSKWSGSVTAHGTVADPDFRGKLSLATGTFKFAKVNFNLTEGVISFHGPASETDISLVAEQTVNDLNVYIALRGPIISPHLTLSSSPDLPLSNLLSRILFNKDISEIDPFQALQLAQTAIQISSGESNIMDRIQDSVGLDVFSFTSPSSVSNNNPDENDLSQPDNSDGQPMSVAVQVGKYLTRGVLLTVTQGTTAESSRYNVDVDLRYGLMLQLETTNQKDLIMSLIWSKTY